MDQNLLVKSGQSLVRRLDETSASPRFAMWVKFSDGNSWRLWMVPGHDMKDKREFYRVVSSTINSYQDEMPGIDVGSVEFVSADKPLVKDMAKFIHAPGIINANLSGNTVNGIYVPEGVLLRSNL
ncbi:hypothetical protein [Rhizobium sp. G21]|uniref:hypothetical protein n=1 Tax=Rhizobium sp. G21 TaxID=2758439 RepID=UPI0015FF229E|nr:hypothetical protein [Rhizobium sp. G21]MBB1250775.1 hypothetical protein [Rhizobium sp. G21]